MQKVLEFIMEVSFEVKVLVDMEISFLIWQWNIRRIQGRDRRSLSLEESLECGTR